MAVILLIDEDNLHAKQLSERLRSRGHQVFVCSRCYEAMAVAYPTDVSFSLVVINISQKPEQGLRCLENLQKLAQRSGQHPCAMFLCASSFSLSPQFVLTVERRGARFVYER